MKDLEDRLRRLRLDAADCELIAKLAMDLGKRRVFERMAEQYRAMIVEIETAIKERSEGSTPEE
jgi:hypothetical protein